MFTRCATQKLLRLSGTVATPPKRSRTPRVTSSSVKKSSSGTEAEPGARTGSVGRWLEHDSIEPRGDAERRKPYSEAVQPRNQRSGEPPEEFSEVGPGCGEDGVDGIARQSGQEAAVHSMIALEVADLGFDGAAAFSAAAFGSGSVAASLSGDVYVHRLGTSVSAIPFVDMAPAPR